MKIITAILLSLGLPLYGATFNVRDLGATGDGKTFDTAAIQKALDACKAAGGTVEFPAGTYLCQPLTLRAKTTLQLDAGATLQASTNQMDFMKTPGDWLKARGGGDFNPLISGKDLTDVTFTGTGVIDGGGAVWWGEAEKARQIRSGYTLPRPNLIVLERCSNVRLENITLQNSPKFHFVPADCEDVVITNVTILAPAHAANTDAIDPSGRRILITKCKLDVGDDNVAIKAGKKIPGHDFESEDITVTDCTFLHGHGMSIGSETTGGVRNVRVSNCTFENTENGLRIKSDARRGGLIENISYENITMSNVVPAITLTCIYRAAPSTNANSGPQMQPELDSTAGDRIPVMRNIHFANVTATCQKGAGIIHAQYEEALRIQPDFPDAHGNLGISLLKAGRPAEAIAHLERAVKLRPDAAEVQTNLGMALASAGRRQEAAAHFERALRLEPGSAEIHDSIGVALFQTGRLPEAIAQYREALRLRPDFPEALDNMGAALLSAGRTGEAIDYIERAVNLRPEFADAHNNLAVALADSGRMPEAIIQYREVLRLKPDLVEAHFNLGNALAETGRLTEAIVEYGEAVRLNPGDAGAHYNLGVALRALGRAGEAKAEFEEAARLHAGP